jgi:GNAT superfamily N-acetyltransferase
MIATQNPDFCLKQAVIEDIPLILNFIKELAEYENLVHEVTATEELLMESLFSGNKTAEVIIGYYKNEAVSFALFFHNFSTFIGRPGIYLEDLYVKPSARRKGFGRIILSYLGYLAKQRGCGRLEWWCLDSNAPALKFYKSLGAEPMSKWTVQRIAGKELENLSGNFTSG